MTTFFMGNNRLIVKYLSDNNGSPYYQRRVPKDLQPRLGLQKIAIPLDPNKGSPVTQVSRLAREHDQLFKLLRADDSIVIPEKKRSALLLLQNFGLHPGDGSVLLDPSQNQGDAYDDQPHLDAFNDYLIDKDRAGTLSEADKLAQRALKKPLPTLLSEVPAIYFENHPKGKDEFFRKKQLLYWNKLIEFAGDMPVSSFNRDLAKKFKKVRQDTGIKSMSVQKDINVIRAMFEKAILEIPLSITNPFKDLRADELGKDSDKREAFTTEELVEILQRCKAQDDDIRRIIVLLIHTGARLGEIVGLRKQDCILDADIPHIKITPYGYRTLKTKNSERPVPLMPKALKALKDQLMEIDGKAVFPRYCDGVGNEKPNADSASAIINKWIATTTAKTAHSFRHTMRGLLRNADIPKDLSEEIGGWGTQSIGDSYGDSSSLKRKQTAIRKAIRNFL